MEIDPSTRNHSTHEQLNDTCKSKHILTTKQADRSQHRNKATALAVLRAKLRQRKQEAVEAERATLRQGLGENGWGNQIRWVLVGRDGLIDGWIFVSVNVSICE